MADGPTPGDTTPTLVVIEKVLNWTTFARFGGSFFAGICEMVTFYPLDTVGKRLMFDSTKRAFRIDEKMRQMREAIFLHGRAAVQWSEPVSVIRSFYAGFLWAGVYKVSQRTWQFGSQPIFRELIDHSWPDVFHARFGHRLGDVLLSATAGALMGVGEIIFVPFNMLKIKSQMYNQDGPVLSLLSSGRIRMPDLWTGWTWTMARNVPGSFALFGGQEVARHWLFKQHDTSVVQHFAASMFGATCSILVASPFDVIKTRVQGEHFGQSKSGFVVARELVRNEGFLALLKGVTPKMLVIGPKLAYGMGLAQLLSAKLLGREGNR